MAFGLVEPFGQEWLQTGTIAAQVTAPYLKKGKKVKPQDFFPVKPPQRQQTGAEMLAIFKMMAAEQQEAKKRRKHVNDRKP